MNALLYSMNIFYNEKLRPPWMENCQDLAWSVKSLSVPVGVV